jgi:hypothetical protein
MDYEQIQSDLGFTQDDKENWIDCNGKYYDDPEQGWKDKLLMHAYPTRSAAVYVMPGYESPATGKWIETPRQRREDMKASGTRPWEGMANERAHTESIKKAEEAKLDAAIDHSVRTAWQHLPDTKKQQALAEAG